MNIPFLIVKIVLFETEFIWTTYSLFSANFACVLTELFCIVLGYMSQK